MSLPEDTPAAVMIHCSKCSTTRWEVGIGLEQIIEPGEDFRRSREIINLATPGSVRCVDFDGSAAIASLCAHDDSDRAQRLLL